MIDSPYYDLRIGFLKITGLVGGVPVPSQEELDKIEQDQGEQALLKVRDNGINGDGCIVEVHLSPPRMDKSSLLLAFTIPDAQLEIVAEAFKTVVRMRKAQGLSKAYPPEGE